MKIKKYWNDKRHFLICLMNKNLFFFLPDKVYLKIKYSLCLRKKIDFDNPKAFNEKLQWLKLYDRKDIYTTMVDKYEVKKYIENIIGKEYIIPTVGIYDRFDDIDFEKLPNQFVIKCTHDSGGLVICKDKNKFDKKGARKIINKSLKRNYYYSGREWPYKNVKPRIIIEKYMGTNLNDYKIFCFNGEPRFTLVCSNRKGNYKNTDFYDNDWNLLPFTRTNHENNPFGIEKPKNFFTMLNIAKKLSKLIPFIRVDLYEIDNIVYFGELTFYPSAGFEGFAPEEWDYKLGKLIDLSLVNKNEK